MANRRVVIRINKRPNFVKLKIPKFRRKSKKASTEIDAINEITAQKGSTDTLKQHQRNTGLPSCEIPLVISGQTLPHKSQLSTG